MAKAKHSKTPAPVNERFSLEWGKIRSSNEVFEDIIFAAEKIIPREKDLIREKYGTSHIVDRSEAFLLLDGHPDEIIVGNGFEGALQLTAEARTLLERSKAFLFVLHSPEAVDLLNKSLAEGKKVNALIHSTC
ncbi:MAG: hypothetical protein AABW59_03165 [archaeon]